jgi:hypothetical protein
LALINRGLFYLHEICLSKALDKDLFDVEGKLRIVPEETADEVVSQELIEVNHLNQVNVQVQGHLRIDWHLAPTTSTWLLLVTSILQHQIVDR